MIATIFGSLRIIVIRVFAKTCEYVSRTPAPPAPVGVPGWWNFDGFCSACWKPRPLWVRAWMTTGVPSFGDFACPGEGLLELAGSRGR